ncbi:hypothetical protein [Hugenholtzia roseola]|uniref:hypothetical protein n=1 Tax=Hugenholtzia roseola TaxID=1002 RepID=UPI0004789A7D|nr:hypothetical protein [Hugenholtzia roseola]
MSNLCSINGFLSNTNTRIEFYKSVIELSQSIVSDFFYVTKNYATLDNIPQEQLQKDLLNTIQSNELFKKLKNVFNTGSPEQKSLAGAIISYALGDLKSEINSQITSETSVVLDIFKKFNISNDSRGKLKLINSYENPLFVNFLNEASVFFSAIQKQDTTDLLQIQQQLEETLRFELPAPAPQKIEPENKTTTSVAEAAAQVPITLSTEAIVPEQTSYTDTNISFELIETESVFNSADEEQEEEAEYNENAYNFEGTNRESIRKIAIEWSKEFFKNKSFKSNSDIDNFVDALYNKSIKDITLDGESVSRLKQFLKREVIQEYLLQIRYALRTPRIVESDVVFKIEGLKPNEYLVFNHYSADYPDAPKFDTLPLQQMNDLNHHFSNFLEKNNSAKNIQRYFKNIDDKKLYTSGLAIYSGTFIFGEDRVLEVETDILNFYKKIEGKKPITETKDGNLDRTSISLGIALKFNFETDSEKIKDAVDSLVTDVTNKIYQNKSGRLYGNFSEAENVDLIFGEVDAQTIEKNKVKTTFASYFINKSGEIALPDSWFFRDIDERNRITEVKYFIEKTNKYQGTTDGTNQVDSFILKLKYKKQDSEKEYTVIIGNLEPPKADSGNYLEFYKELNDLLGNNKEVQVTKNNIRGVGLGSIKELGYSLYANSGYMYLQKYGGKFNQEKHNIYLFQNLMTGGVSDAEVSRLKEKQKELAEKIKKSPNSEKHKKILKALGSSPKEIEKLSVEKIIDILNRPLRIDTKDYIKFLKNLGYIVSPVMINTSRRGSSMLFFTPPGTVVKIYNSESKKFEEKRITNEKELIEYVNKLVTGGNVAERGRLLDLSRVGINAVYLRRKTVGVKELKELSQLTQSISTKSEGNKTNLKKQQLFNFAQAKYLHFLVSQDLQKNNDNLTPEEQNIVKEIKGLFFSDFEKYHTIFDSLNDEKTQEDIKEYVNLALSFENQIDNYLFFSESQRGILKTLKNKGITNLKDLFSTERLKERFKLYSIIVPDERVAGFLNLQGLTAAESRFFDSTLLKLITIGRQLDYAKSLGLKLEDIISSSTVSNWNKRNDVKTVGKDGKSKSTAFFDFSGAKLIDENSAFTIFEQPEILSENKAELEKYNTLTYNSILKHLDGKNIFPLSAFEELSSRQKETLKNGLKLKLSTTADFNTKEKISNLFNSLIKNISENISKKTNEKRIKVFENLLDQLQKNQKKINDLSDDDFKNLKEFELYSNYIEIDGEVFIGVADGKEVYSLDGKYINYMFRVFPEVEVDKIKKRKSVILTLKKQDLTDKFNERVEKNYQEYINSDTPKQKQLSNKYAFDNFGGLSEFNDSDFDRKLNIKTKMNLRRNNLSFNSDNYGTIVQTGNKNVLKVNIDSVGSFTNTIYEGGVTADVVLEYFKTVSTGKSEAESIEKAEVTSAQESENLDYQLVYNPAVDYVKAKVTRTKDNRFKEAAKLFVKRDGEIIDISEELTFAFANPSQFHLVLGNPTKTVQRDREKPSTIVSEEKVTKSVESFTTAEEFAERYLELAYPQFDKSSVSHRSVKDFMSAVFYLGEVEVTNEKPLLARFKPLESILEYHKAAPVYNEIRELVDRAQEQLDSWTRLTLRPNPGGLLEDIPEILKYNLSDLYYMSKMNVKDTIFDFYSNGNIEEGAGITLIYDLMAESIKEDLAKIYSSKNTSQEFNPFEDDLFRTEQKAQPIDYDIPEQEALSIIANVFGEALNNDDIRFISKQSFFKGKQILGKAAKDVLEFHTKDDLVSEQVVRHEILHKILNEFISPKRYKKIVEEAKRLMLKDLNNFYVSELSKDKELSLDNITDSEAEEYLALKYEISHKEDPNPLPLLDALNKEIRSGYFRNKTKSRS